MGIKQLHVFVLFVVAFLFPGHLSGNGCEEEFVLKNQYIRIVFGGHPEKWRLKSLSRLDGSDMIRINCDVFEILMLNGERYTGNDYKAEGPLMTINGKNCKRYRSLINENRLLQKALPAW
ncbi:MAG: hypothetical protein KAT15_16795 [Bacteroidales bacterium]|nr:hypothetical protein [Bacteroidales bacterium]